MTATDELRALLDERGIEWGETRDGSTAFSNADGNVRWAIACGAAKSFLEVGPLTPAQAIAATLGRGEVDLPDIVRCRDCRFMHTVRSWLGMDVDECWLHADRETGALGKNRTEPNGFCAWGERREGK